MADTCGLGPCFRPAWLRKYATARTFLIVYGLLGTVQSMAYIYFVATLTTLEKRFKIPSKTTGLHQTAGANRKTETRKIILPVKINATYSKSSLNFKHKFKCLQDSGKILIFLSTTIYYLRHETENQILIRSSRHVLACYQLIILHFSGLDIKWL
jgi:hypothetical protein